MTKIDWAKDHDRELVRKNKRLKTEARDELLALEPSDETMRWVCFECEYPCGEGHAFKCSWKTRYHKHKEDPPHSSPDWHTLHKIVSRERWKEIWEERLSPAEDPSNYAMLPRVTEELRQTARMEPAIEPTQPAQPLSKEQKEQLPRVTEELRQTARMEPAIEPTQPAQPLSKEQKEQLRVILQNLTGRYEE